MTHYCYGVVTILSNGRLVCVFINLNYFIRNHGNLFEKKEFLFFFGIILLHLRIQDGSQLDREPLIFTCAGVLGLYINW